MSQELCTACTQINLYALGAHEAYHNIWRPSLNPALARDRNELVPTCPMCCLIESCILRNEAEEDSEGSKVTRFSLVARPDQYSQKVGFNPSPFHWYSFFSGPVESLVLFYHYRFDLPRTQRLAEKSVYRLRKVEEIQVEVQYDRILSRMNNRVSRGRNYTVVGRMDIFASPSMFQYQPCLLPSSERLIPQTNRLKPDPWLSASRTYPHIPRFGSIGFKPGYTRALPLIANAEKDYQELCIAIRRRRLHSLKE